MIAKYRRRKFKKPTTLFDRTSEELAKQNNQFMLYVISGASRAGKTMIAHALSKKTGLSYLSIDWLVMGFTNGIPEYGIHDKLMPDEIATRSWSFLKAMMENMLWSDIDYIIEGEAILPELITELRVSHPNNLKICFVGYTAVNVKNKLIDVKNYSDGHTDWLSDKSDEYTIDHIQNMIGFSHQIMNACMENNLHYFDTSDNFLPTIDKALKFLVDK